ncbi:MAG: hypothetical protein BWY85_00270 [Firmicutes bacterium ADurb.Bin506]|nr:MAG: hypothetical protein BWY85_00270 [Firmicutes bacterium ADurb.Bin506]
MSCYGCACHTCANNEERLGKTPGEAVFFCYTCDHCIEYVGREPGARYNKREECEHYKLADEEIKRRRAAIEHEAQRRRAALKVINGKETT